MSVYTVKAHVEEVVQPVSFLNLQMDGVMWSASRRSRFSPWETHQAPIKQKTW
jgi:hypothetical protein